MSILLQSVMLEECRLVIYGKYKIKHGQVLSLVMKWIHMRTRVVPAPIGV